MPTYIDTHAHLYLEEFDPDRTGVIETAVHRGVERILLPNIDHTTTGPMNALADQFPDICFPMIGLHPTSVKEDFKSELQEIAAALDKNRYWGIGEIGIDLYWDKTYLREQKQVFANQLDLALQYGLPVAIHARESFGEILDVMEGYRQKGLTGVFHAFSGSTDIARQVIDLGFLLGIGGMITYKKSSLPDVVRVTGLQHLVLETDSPYLPPVPFRGKRNESSYIPFIAEAVQRFTRTSVEEVARITTENALQLFFSHAHA